MMTIMACVGLALWPPTALAADRVALVIGNSAYTAVSRLDNPEHDAADVGAALERLDFEVTTTLNASRLEMVAAVRAFEDRSEGAEIALLFYAGHGLEMAGENYLVPVDARLERATDVADESLALDRILERMTAARTRVLILDACRNNPFVRGMRGTTRAAVRAGGLAAVASGEGLLVAYAAAAGATAGDGTGQRNSPYTSALLTRLERPGVELRVMLGNVGGDVARNTDAGQQPFIYTSLTGEYYLRGQSAVVATAVAGELSEARIQQDTVFWQSIANSTDRADFQAYLRAFPDGSYAQLARNREASLRDAASGSPSAFAAASPAARPVDAARFDPPRTPSGPVVFLVGVDGEVVRQFARRCSDVEIARGLGEATFVAIGYGGNAMGAFTGRGVSIGAARTMRKGSILDDMCEAIVGRSYSEALITVRELVTSEVAGRAETPASSMPAVFVAGPEDAVEAFYERGCSRVRLTENMGDAHLLVFFSRFKRGGLNKDFHFGAVLDASGTLLGKDIAMRRGALIDDMCEVVDGEVYRGVEWMTVGEAMGGTQ